MHLSRAAVEYAWSELLRRAGVQEEGLWGLVYGGFEIEGRLGRLKCVPATGESWHQLIATGAEELSWLDPETGVARRLGALSRLPVLFWGRDAARDTSAVAFDQRTIYSSVDIIACTVFMLSRWEETVIPTRDRHGRFPARSSVAARGGFLHLPVVDEYALLLRRWFRQLLPRWEPVARRSVLSLSHDIDLIRNYRTIGIGVRVAVGELLKAGAPGAAASAALRVCGDLTGGRGAMPYRNIRTLADMSVRRGLRGAFNFMAAGPSEMDGDYELSESKVTAIARHLAEQGFAIGFHPGYHTYGDVGRLEEEARTFEGVFGMRPMQGRQHYLRFAAPLTWRHWEQVGIRVDSSLGFADCAGFRCGTCHPYYPFDLAEDRSLGVLEVPLIVMDVTLRGYERLTPSEAVLRVADLARACRKAEGDLTLLWHNTSFRNEWDGWDGAYGEMIDVCMGIFE